MPKKSKDDNDKKRGQKKGIAGNLKGGKVAMGGNGIKKVNNSGDQQPPIRQAMPDEGFSVCLPEDRDSTIYIRCVRRLIEAIENAHIKPEATLENSPTPMTTLLDQIDSLLGDLKDTRKKASTVDEISPFEFKYAACAVAKALVLKNKRGKAYYASQIIRWSLNSLEATALTKKLILNDGVFKRTMPWIKELIVQPRTCIDSYGNGKAFEKAKLWIAPEEEDVEED